MEAAGNDFIIVDEQFNSDKKPHTERERSQFALKWCQRKKGIGADGVIFIVSSKNSDIGMYLFQPDGSSAATSGNGMRCVARYAGEEGYFKDKNGKKEGKIKTEAGVKKAIYSEGKARIEMGETSFDPTEIPSREKIERKYIEGYEVTACNTGVPHTVAFIDKIGQIDIEKEAPPIRNSKIFPEGTNVNFASPIEDGYEVRTFERGVESETLSCGSGAVAVASVSRKLGKEKKSKSNIKIKTKGGELRVHFEGDNAFLEGEVNRVYDGELKMSSTP